jgi:hypothetical protein
MHNKFMGFMVFFWGFFVLLYQLSSDWMDTRKFWSGRWSELYVAGGGGVITVAGIIHGGSSRMCMGDES